MKRLVLALGIIYFVTLFILWANNVTGLPALANTGFFFILVMMGAGILHELNRYLKQGQKIKIDRLVFALGIIYFVTLFIMLLYNVIELPVLGDVILFMMLALGGYFALYHLNGYLKQRQKQKGVGTSVF
jgi:hypothetical protein